MIKDESRFCIYCDMRWRVNREQGIGAMPHCMLPSMHYLYVSVIRWAGIDWRRRNLLELLICPFRHCRKHMWDTLERRLFDYHMQSLNPQQVRAVLRDEIPCEISDIVINSKTLKKFHNSQ